MKVKFPELRIFTVFMVVMTPPSAHAEPSASMSHIPVLWLFAIGIAGLTSWGLLRLSRRSLLLQSPVKKWTLAIIIFAATLLFVAPLFVALGSILITGRTM